MLIKHVLILSNYYVKSLINTCFGFVTLRKSFDAHDRKCCKEKVLWENQKKQNHSQVSHSFKNSFMLKNMPKKLVKTNNISKGPAPT